MAQPPISLVTLILYLPGVYDAGLLVVVGYDAADEVGVGLVEGGEQRLQLGPERRRHRLVLLSVLA